MPSILGTAAMKCSFSGVIPRPGTPAGTLTATLRSSSESMTSPSRSSSRFIRWSFRLDRTSMERDAVTIRWMPYPSPRAAMSVAAASRAS